MVRAAFLAIWLVTAATLSAQERATTESGRRLLVYPDGTWKPAPAATLPSGDHNRPASATERITLAGGKASVYYDPTEWVETEGAEPGRHTLTHVTGDGYGILMGERLQMTTDGLRNVALINARKAAPDATVTREEHRLVNGHEVLLLQITGSLQGINFVYLGYYYAGPEGTYQILTYTSANLLDEYQESFEKLLDGFEVGS